MSDEKKPHEPPKAGVGDKALTLARAGISAIPFVGSPAVELLGLIVTPPLDKRRHEWMEAVGESLRKLETESKVKLDELQNNPAFIDTVLHASEAAIKTSEAVKRDALRNAVLNSALPTAPDANRQQIFLYLVDSLTAWHLKMLTLFTNPPKWFRENDRQPPANAISGSLAQTLTTAFPEMNGQRELFEPVFKDLYNRGLTNTDSLMTMMSSEGAMAKRTSKLGDEFLAFISAPIK